MGFQSGWLLLVPGLVIGESLIDKQKFPFASVGNLESSMNPKMHVFEMLDPEDKTRKHREKKKIQIPHKKG